MGSPHQSGGVAGWGRRWTVDDGFIVCRVVDHVLSGNGVVFNAGERVEAVTSPLWLAMLAGARAVLPVPVEGIAVIPGLAAAVPASLQAGRPVTIDVGDTIADGIAVSRPGELTLAHIAALVDDVVTVDDEALARAVLLLVERAKQAAEVRALPTNDHRHVVPVDAVLDAQAPELASDRRVLLARVRRDPRFDHDRFGGSMVRHELDARAADREETGTALRPTAGPSGVASTAARWSCGGRGWPGRSARSECAAACSPRRGSPCASRRCG